jgi:O-acetyl-ADP-ribose deacetylase (regulator of RNase III)
MSITYKIGNIFDNPTQALVNPVNCVGVMGKGLALEFKKRFPDNFNHYAKCCKSNILRLGIILPYKIENTNIFPEYIINFPTKYHWKDNSHMESIMSGLTCTITYAITEDIKSISIPALGCGLGGLHWGEVKEYIDDACRSVDDIDFVVFEPN